MFGFIFLSERITKIETIALGTSFVGVFILVNNTSIHENHESNAAQSEIAQKDYIEGIISLICAPILMALGSIQTRKMKDLHEYTANFYAIIVGSVVFGLWVLLTDEGLQFYNIFYVADYLILCSLSVIQGMSVVS